MITFSSITWCTTRICLTAAVAARRGAFTDWFTPLRTPQHSACSADGVLNGMSVVEPACAGDVSLHFAKKAACLAPLIRYVESKPRTFDASWRLCRSIKSPAAIITSTCTPRTLPSPSSRGVRQDETVWWPGAGNDLKPFNRNLTRVMSSVFHSVVRDEQSHLGLLVSCLSAVFPGVRWSYKCIWRQRLAALSTC